MTKSLLTDAFAHHIWATERLIDACLDLTPEQLEASAPGTYGSILATFRRLVGSDAWYLGFLREVPAPIDEDVASPAALPTVGGARVIEMAGDDDRDRRVLLPILVLAIATRCLPG